MGDFVAAGTWKFSYKGVLRAGELLSAGKEALDAVEAGVVVVEDDPEVFSVGSGGYPNLHGEVELDAAIMCGATLAAGAVLGVKGFRHPVSIARALMEKTPHIAVAGRGADEFAYAAGFQKEPRFYQKAWERWFALRDTYLTDGQKYPPLDSCAAGSYGTGGNSESSPSPGDGHHSHDTVGVIALDQRGCVAAATSTSGLALKIPGRIGDSPVIGSGFYADDRAGAAVATGVGEEIMRGCLSIVRSCLCLRAAAPRMPLLRQWEPFTGGSWQSAGKNRWPVK
ncbi:MAG: isoaspartyl peptidase/L-asparaginase [Treponema sp.]|jgi:isoaspartyl peptidase/L-asparaginase-like protein (Ntn-hydrolase superfamily)|nr:isoaspartyl peptidase/L-asparaginase [Treponema sp.]